MMRKWIAMLLIWMLCVACAAAESAPADGLYTIGVSSSSKMFKIVNCLLRVEEGKLTAVMTMSGSGYGYLYQGTSAEADAAPVENWTPFFEDEEGRHCFVIEIPALDTEFPMAAWSIRYSKWYDRTVQFFSNTLRPYALVAPDGVYSGVLSSDTLMDGMECLLRSRDGEMTLEMDVGEGVQLTVNGQAAELAGGVARVAIPSLDLRMSVSIDGEEGWLKLESAAIAPYTVTAEDGVYSIEARTDSGLLKFTDCRLTIADGGMKALLTAKNNSFDYLYLGLAADANAHSDAWIPAVPNAEGAYTYEIPVESLDNEISVATYSAKKKLWYDRKIVFDSSTLTTE